MEVIPHSGLLYSLLSFIALLLSYGWLAWRGFRAGLPKFQWLITLFVTSLFFILGSKIFTVGLVNFLLGNFSNDEVLTQHSALGGLLFGLIAILITDSYFAFKRRSFDHFALIVPISMSIQKIGCLIVGCCFGKTCSLPWAIRYPSGSIPHAFHVNQSLISSTQRYSLGVHPAQVYLMVATLIGVWIVYRTRLLWKQPGSLLLFSMFVVSITRFLTDFFREPYSYPIGNATSLGLTYIQYGTLIVLVIVGILLRINESTRKGPSPLQTTPPVKAILLALAALIFFFLVDRWFDSWEKLVTVLKFLPVGFLLLITFYKRLTISGYRFVPLIVIGACVIFTNQKHIPQPDSVVSSYRSVSGGFSTGKFVNSLSYGDPSGCDSKTRYFEQEHTSFGVGYATTTQKTKSTIEKGVSIFGGNQTETWQDNPDKRQTFAMWGVNGFIKGDRKWMGIGMGMNIGNLRFTFNNGNKDNSSTTLPKKGSWNTPIMPSFYFRIGPQSILFTEYNWAQFFPAPSPGFHSSLALGSGFGAKNGFHIKVGTFFYGGTFMSAYVPIHNKIVIQPLYHFGSTLSPDGGAQRQFSLAFHYRFDHR